MVVNNPISECTGLTCDCDSPVASYSATASGIICFQEEAALFTLQLPWGMFEGTVPADTSRWLKWPVARWIYRRWRKKHPRTVEVEMTQVSPDGAFEMMITPNESCHAKWESVINQAPATAPTPPATDRNSAR